MPVLYTLNTHISFQLERTVKDEQAMTDHPFINTLAPHQQKGFAEFLFMLSSSEPLII